ncbi:ANR family transcriptional regulator [Enterobacter bugandensis]
MKRFGRMATVDDFESSMKFTDSFSYSFSSRIAVLLEKNHKWKDAMMQWTYAMHQAKIHENKVWAYQRALFCRKQYININKEIDLPDLDVLYFQIVDEG